jgi:hypothetical protein
MDAEAYADMLPWLVFIVVDRKAGLGAGWAGACAAFSGGALAAWAFWRSGRRAPLPLLAVGVFGACFLVALVSPWWAGQVAITRALTVGALSVTAFVSIGSFGLRPLSEPYTASHVCAATRSDARFRRVNIEITRAWGVGALLAAASYGVAQIAHDDVGLTFFNWILPLAITGGTVLWAGRRWELFHLEVDAAAAANSPSGRVDAARARPWLDGDNSVIRRLPVRRPPDN